MGHVMFTAGLLPSQYFWCTACGGYSGQRIQKLARQCSGTYVPNAPVEKLILALHPYANVMLATPPRRVTRRDAGVYGNLADGSPTATVEYFNAHGDDTLARLHVGSGKHVCSTDTVGCPPSPHPVLAPASDEDGPLSLGFALD